MRIAAQHESSFDPITCARELDSLHAVATVLAREILGRDSCCFDDARIEHKLSRRGRSRRVEIGNRLRGGLDGCLARALHASVQDDALLSGAKSHDRGRSDPERKDNGQDRLTALVTHGVHSTRRAAAPSMSK
jgi:hypothetical protein